MALNVRLLGRGILRCHSLRLAALPQYRTVTLEPRCATIPDDEGHDEKNRRLCRPQSPHLTIYKFQLTSILSITHRFTGIALSGYAAMFAITSLLANKPMGEIIQTLSYNYPTIFFLFKAGMVFPFTYHFFNGIRHLVWYTGNALSIKGVYISGYIVLFLTIVSTIFFMCHQGDTKSDKGNGPPKIMGPVDLKKCIKVSQSPPPVPPPPPPPSPFPQKTEKFLENYDTNKRKDSKVKILIDLE